MDTFLLNNIFDSHAHYDDESFNCDRDTLLEELPNRGVCGVVTCGADLEGCRAAVDLAAQYDYIYAAAGIHPECVKDMPANYLELVEDFLSSGKVVAVGEIGLDYHFEDNAPRAMQRQAFADQIALAQKHGLPVIVHDRDAHGDTMDILRRTAPSSVEMAREVIRLGMYIGIGGAVTFKNARIPVEVAKFVPLDRLLVETDAPYMTPVPFRGKRCDSSMIAYTAEKIAEIRGIPAQELLDATRANAKRLFRI